MHRIARVLDAVLNSVLITLMVALVAAVSWQVISRYVFASPSSWTEEVARFLMIWVGLLGAAYAFRSGVHLGFDLLPNKLSGRSAQILKIFTLGAVILFSVTILIRRTHLGIETILGGARTAHRICLCGHSVGGCVDLHLRNCGCNGRGCSGTGWFHGLGSLIWLPQS